MHLCPATHALSIQIHAQENPAAREDDRIRPQIASQASPLMAAIPSTNDGTLDLRAFVAGMRRFATSAQVCVWPIRSKQWNGMDASVRLPRIECTTNTRSQ